MKARLTIFYFFLLLLKASARPVVAFDSTVWTLKVQLIDRFPSKPDFEYGFQDFEYGYRIQKYKVLESNFIFPVYTVFISHKGIIPGFWGLTTTLRIKGYLSFRTVSFLSMWGRFLSRSYIHLTPVFWSPQY